ncbi:MAG: hypothetical protein KGI84_08505, partial [Elusimicrobia bacterium]|nr:hypothetical protein [Elusimicrobiota bacterium]
SQKRHASFDKIFTWHDGFVDGKKYVKINFFQNIAPLSEVNIHKKEKFCTMIANYKHARGPLELYSRRIEAIRWFERNHPEDFDLYGGGWAELHSPRSIAKALLACAPRRIFESRFSSYRGRAQSKKEILSKYKFSICYENAQGIPGYITEKILDCFLAGCVPVYWGAPNVADHIPKQAFINFLDFNNYESLYRHLRNMTEAAYMGHINAIRNFLDNEQGRRFSAEFFAEQVSARILEDLSGAKA